ncbi:MAG: hypothetical protein HC898_01920 [Phycisphaerales bacterium]|nr:hypothetical protein [Phycisphaerales bacterium]
MPARRSAIPCAKWSGIHLVMPLLMAWLLFSVTASMTRAQTLTSEQQFEADVMELTKNPHRLAGSDLAGRQGITSSSAWSPWVSIR